MEFCRIIFLAGIYILIESLILGKKVYLLIISVAPFGISLVVSIIAGFATFKGTDLFFSIDNDKIEYKFGMLKPVTHSFHWNDIKELVMPRKQKKIKLIFKDGSSFIINLTWIQRKKSSHIRKQFSMLQEKRILMSKVIDLFIEGIKKKWAARKRPTVLITLKLT